MDDDARVNEDSTGEKPRNINAPANVHDNEEVIVDPVEQGHSRDFSTDKFWKVCDAGLPLEKSRIHTHIEGRYITVFRQKGILSAIDSICYHAGGPLTLGELQDIEELNGITAVSCPWHKFLVSITDGTRIYQKVTIVNGKPSVEGWTVGKVVHRAHKVVEDDRGVYVVRFCPIIFVICTVAEMKNIHSLLVEVYE